MRVACKKKSSGRYRYDLTVGQQYEVIEVAADHYRVLDDTGRPYLFPKSVFRVIDATRPRDWVSEVFDGDEYASAPAFRRPGFFEDYFDRNPKAIREFNRYINQHLRLTDAA